MRATVAVASVLVGLGMVVLAMAVGHCSFAVAWLIAEAVRTGGA